MGGRWSNPPVYPTPGVLVHLAQLTTALGRAGAAVALTAFFVSGLRIQAEAPGLGLAAAWASFVPGFVLLVPVLVLVAVCGVVDHRRRGRRGGTG